MSETQLISPGYYDKGKYQPKHLYPYCPPELTHCLKYLYRLGNKPNEDPVECARKALTWLVIWKENICTRYNIENNRPHETTLSTTDQFLVRIHLRPVSTPVRKHIREVIVGLQNTGNEYFKSVLSLFSGSIEHRNTISYYRIDRAISMANQILYAQRRKSLGK